MCTRDVDDICLLFFLVPFVVAAAASVWQLMRKYTFSLLTKLSPDGKPIEDKEILAWVNQKLQQGGKSSITSFQDKSIRTAKPVLDLIECMKPHTINDAFVMTGDKLSDAVSLLSPESCQNCITKTQRIRNYIDIFEMAKKSQYHSMIGHHGINENQERLKYFQEGFFFKIWILEWS